MEEKRNKILLSIDGTDESRTVINYACETLPPTVSETHLFHVMSSVPEVFWDLEKEPNWLKSVESVRQYEKKQQEHMANFFESSLKIFRDAGFTEGPVSRIATVQKGIARDILTEAQKGYDALLIGRGKSGALKEMPLGSVASKILSAVPSPAVWLIGARPSSAKVLLAIDSSENAIRAVKHAGKMLQQSKSSITLFHAVRKLSVSIDGIEDIFPSKYQQRLLDEATQEIQPTFKLAVLWLSKMGISSERIDTKIVTGASSRAATILEEAEKGDYGTIIVGRRGVSEVPDFSMGRVTNKLIQTAKQQTVWIIG